MNARTHYRRWGRRPIRLQATVQTPTGEWRCEAQTVNLSFEGSCVELLETPASGDTLTLMLLGPRQWEPIELPATVRWSARAPDSRHHRVGFHFTRATAASVRTLLELLDSSLY